MIRSNIVLKTEGLSDIIITPKEYFSYKPYIPSKRSIVKETQKAVFIQRSVPCFVTGEFSFESKIFKQNADALLQFYRQCSTIEFSGQYGEVLGVEILELEVMYGYRLAEVTGKFQVLCEITENQPQCRLEE